MTCLTTTSRALSFKRLRQDAQSPDLRPDDVSFMMSAAYREPLCPSRGVTPQQSGVQRRFGRRYPAFIAPMGSCAVPLSSRPPLALALYGGSLQVAPSPLLDLGTSRRYLRSLCIGARTRAPQFPFSAYSRFFPKGFGLASTSTGSAHRNLAAMQLQRRLLFRGCSHSLNVRAPILARPPGCTYRCNHHLITGQPGLLHHAMDMWFPTCTVVSLRA